MRVLGVDPGEKNIGLSISDETGTIANPYLVITHVSRIIDAATIATLATEQKVAVIVIGQSLDDQGNPTFEGRRAARLAAAVSKQTNIPVNLWDESGSTQTARNARIALGVRRKKRHGHMDDLAATVILQSYLDGQMQS